MRFKSTNQNNNSMRNKLYTLLVLICLPLFSFANSTSSIGPIGIDSLVLVAPCCGLDNGIVTLYASGAENLFYSIDGGASFQEDHTFTDLAADDYLIIVTDGLSCTTTTTINLVESASGCTALAANLKFEFRTIEEPLEPGDPFFIECYVSDFVDVLSFEFTLDFNSDIIQFDEINSLGSPLVGDVESRSGISELENGKLSIIWTNLILEGQTISDGPIFKIFFDVIGDTNECMEWSIASQCDYHQITFGLESGEFCEIEDINVQFSSNPLCLFCGDNLSLNYYYCQEILEINACGGTEPYNYELNGPQGFSQSGMFNSNDTLTFTGLPTGIYDIIIDDGGLLVEFIELSPSTFSSVISSVQICNDNSSSFPSFIDFDDLITTPTPRPYIILDFNGEELCSSIIDFLELPPGVYSYTYQIEVPNTCQEEIFTTEVQVIDCECPVIGLSLPAEFCNTQSINLSDYLIIGTEAGSFTLLDENGNLYLIQPSSDGNLLPQDLETGNYTVIYTLNEIEVDCPTSATSTFTIIEGVTPSFTEPPPVCNSDETGQTTILDLNDLVTTDNGFWSNSDGNIISDGLIDFNGAQEGSVDFIHTTNQAPCDDITSILTVEVLDCTTTSTSETIEQDISIYPNPTSDQFTINLEQASNLKLFDLNGTSLMDLSLSAGSNKVNSDELSSGVYIMVIYQKDKITKSQKLVISK